MFSPDIVSSEEFLSMPVSSRELYFQLGMNADDDGFIQPKLIMRLAGATDDDLKVLLAKRFLLTFESGVVVIKHWLIHNMIRADRYKLTRFQDEKKLLFIKENKAYTEHNQLGCQNDNQMAPQVRLGKVRLGKDRELSNDSVPSKTLKEFRNLRRVQAGNPPMEKKVATEKQKAFLKRMKSLDYFHTKGVENGFDYLEEEDESANRKFQGIARTFEKRYGDNYKEVVDWWFAGDNAWCDYHPSNFYSVGTWMKFDNSSKNKTGGIIHLED